MRKFLAVLHARNMEFLRDRSALAWNLAMPFMLVIGLAFTFSSSDRDIYKIGLVGGLDKLHSVAPALQSTRYISYVPYDDLNAAIGKVKHHQMDMLIDVSGTPRYWINSSSPSGYLLERIVRGAEGHRFERQVVEGAEIRYVDWFLPGILGMNMMFACLFGVGFVIVRYRKNGFLKRLKATPLGAFQFLFAQLISRLLLIMLVTMIVYTGCNFFIEFNMQGSYWTLLLVTTLGAMSMISIGLLIAARTASEELAGGILNLVVWPMMLLSGAWFSLEGAQVWVQKISLIFPLTHMISAARAIMNEGATLLQVMPHVWVLALMSIFFVAIGAYVFKWE
ncbi:MAG: ABC transporter permease [Nitrosomonadales bacterium]|nr:ABC transporter permease [Nitrosomonadales bacterium]